MAVIRTSKSLVKHYNSLIIRGVLNYNNMGPYCSEEIYCCCNKNEADIVLETNLIIQCGPFSKQRV